MRVNSALFRQLVLVQKSVPVSVPGHPDHVPLYLHGHVVHHGLGAGVGSEPVEAEAAVRLEALGGDDIGQAVRLAAAGKEEEIIGL